MTKLLDLFRKNIDVVTDDHRKATEETMRQLKQLTPLELLRRGPDTWTRLTTSQYREIVETIAPDVHLPDAPEQNPDRAIRSKSAAAWWRPRSSFARSLYLTTIATFVVLIAAVEIWPIIAWTLSPYTLIRNVDASQWPRCDRLSRTTDGCVYVPTQDLNWEWIAYQADIPLDVLLRSNTHLPATNAPIGSKVTIWRFRGQLLGVNNE